MARFSPPRVWLHETTPHIHRSPLTHLSSDPAQEDVSFFLLFELDPNQLFFVGQGHLDKPLA